MIGSEATPPVGTETQGDALQPVGLQAAAAMLEAGGGELGAPAPEKPPIDYVGIATTTARALFGALGTAVPEFKMGEPEYVALGNAWGPVLQEKMPNMTPTTMAVIVTCGVVGPRVGAYVVRRSADKKAAAKAPARAEPEAA